MKNTLRLVVVAGCLAVAPMSAYAFVDILIRAAAEITFDTVRKVKSDYDTADGIVKDLNARKSEQYMTPEEKKARDEVMKQTFEELSADLPENEREAEMDRLLVRFMELAPQQPLVTDRLDILRDEAAAKKAGGNQPKSGMETNKNSSTRVF